MEAAPPKTENGEDKTMNMMVLTPSAPGCDMKNSGQPSPRMHSAADILAPGLAADHLVIDIGRKLDAVRADIEQITKRGKELSSTNEPSEIKAQESEMDAAIDLERVLLEVLALCPAGSLAALAVKARHARRDATACNPLNSPEIEPDFSIAAMKVVMSIFDDIERLA